MRHIQYGRLFVALFVVFMAGTPVIADQANADPSAWRLTSVTWDDKDKRGVNGGVVLIDQVTANSQGGTIRLTFNGKGPCAGKAQRFRFTWRFDRDITTIAGKSGDLVAGATATLEGEPANCIDGNPYWNLGEYGDFLGTVRGGWGTHYFKDPPNTLPGRMTFSLRITNRTKEGIVISLASNWAGDYSFAGLNLQVLYLYEPLPNGAVGTGATAGGGSSGSSSIGGRTADGNGGRVASFGGTVGTVTAATVRYSQVWQRPQGELRDATGRITQEAAVIHLLRCQNGAVGRTILVYEYQNRRAFRAILPPDYTHLLGGRDFSTFAEAVAAGCSP